MRILGIETSADDTGVAIIEATGHFWTDLEFTVLANEVRTQSQFHAAYGGIYPNLAKNKHQENLVPLLENALGKAGMRKETYTDTSVYEHVLIDTLAREANLKEQLAPFLQRCAKPDIDAIAVTVGPGLEPALWVGINFAKVLSQVWNIPIVSVNHMEGHIVISALLGGNDGGVSKQVSGFNSPPRTWHLSPITFPMLSLLISGGHTELVLSKQFRTYEYIGRTRDDAVGEAFDKVARMLGLRYPGGPHISRLAEEARQNDGFRNSVILPRPMIHEQNFDFSFAGLKTAVRRFVEANTPVSEELKRSIAREFEDAVTEILVEKTMHAADLYGIKTLVIGGGVSANKNIRAHFARECESSGIALRATEPEFSTDNALMIALAGYFKTVKGEFAEQRSLSAQGALKLTDMQ